MAYLYDIFYSQKNYSKEVDFICHFTNNTDDKILDAGCGTGNHAYILNSLGYTHTFGFDISKEMIDIANKKIPNHFKIGNLLNFSSKEKFNLIISFFAVFNHLKSIKQFKQALLNLKTLCLENGIIIIDLHNPQCSGKKTETIGNATRTMEWRKSSILNKEYSTITFDVNDNHYVGKHTFSIFKLHSLRNLAQQLNFKKVEFYENYNLSKHATAKSKNIQMVLFT
jgi:SAM-dependent methyltransferase